MSSQQGWRTSTRCGPGLSLREKRVLSPRSRSSTVTCACWRTCSFTSSTSAGLAGGGAVRWRLFSEVGTTALTVGGAAGGTVLDLASNFSRALRSAASFSSATLFSAAFARARWMATRSSQPAAPATASATIATIARRASLNSRSRRRMRSTRPRARAFPGSSDSARPKAASAALVRFCERCSSPTSKVRATSRARTSAACACGARTNAASSRTGSSMPASRSSCVSSSFTSAALW